MEIKEKAFYIRFIVGAIIVAFALGLIFQFVWKIIYAPETTWHIMCEMVFITTLAGFALGLLSKENWSDNEL